MAHNVVYYNTSDGAITRYSNTDVSQLAEYVLELMAAGTYAGTIVANTSNPIGTFTDTVRQGGVGSTDVTILSNTYTLSQVTTVQSVTDPPMYLGLEVSGNSVVLHENSTTLNDLADEIIQQLISDYGVNSYYLGESAPSDGGVWVSRGFLKDTLENFSVTNANYQLWHKTTSSTYTSYKAPLKLTASVELQSWSDTDVQDLIKKVEERIVATGIGTYSLQTAAPGTGTWAQVGTVNDVRRNVITDPQYTGTGLSYTATFLGAVEQTFTDPDGTSFSGSFITAYLGPATFTNPDATPFTGNFTSTYLGPQTFTNPDATPFTGNFTSTYLGPQTFTSPTYLGPATFTNPNAVSFGGGSFSTGYTSFANYIGPTAPLPIYQGTAQYTGGGPTSYFTDFFFQGPTFSGPVYLGPASYIGDNVNSFSTPYVGDNAISYVGNFTGPSYLGPGNFTNPDAISYVGNFTGPSYLGPQSFTNPDATTFNDTYIGPNYAGPADYVGTVSVNYDGQEFTGDSNYTGPSIVDSTTSIISTVTLWKRIL